MGCSLVVLDCRVAPLLAETVRGSVLVGLPRRFASRRDGSLVELDCHVASLLAETVRGSVLVGLPRRFASRRDES